MGQYTNHPLTLSPDSTHQANAASMSRYSISTLWQGPACPKSVREFSAFFNRSRHKIMIGKTTCCDDQSTMSLPQMVDVHYADDACLSVDSAAKTEQLFVGVSTTKRFNFLVVGPNGSGNFLDVNTHALLPII